MTISRQTVDKLGVKLYDRASAVVAELIANSFDSDAEHVRVKLPLSTLLGRDDGSSEHDYVIEVCDDGHGMEPDEADNHFLVVGQDRRRKIEQGATSRLKKRPVMGRKGIGKLAPFGICREIEVISSGGGRTHKGYLTAHFSMDYDAIVEDTDTDYHPDPAELDRTYQERPGTTIRLSRFLKKRVPDKDTFLRQLAQRFGMLPHDFTISVEDTRNPEENPPVSVEPVNIPVNEKTRIDLSDRPVRLDDGDLLPVSGWVAMAKENYSSNEFAGVRIYARSKIVAITRDFGLISGYTGEFTLKAYLVGEIHAEWLDQDDGEDLVKTDRQDILWESDYGQAMSLWGQDLLKEIGQKSRQPRRESVRDRFLGLARIEERATERYSDERITETAIALAGTIGGFAAEDELEDETYIEGLSEIILSVAPHQTLMEAFRAFNAQVTDQGASLESLVDLFSTTRIAELASYGQIAFERVTVLEKLEEVIVAKVDEPSLQKLISNAPWLIDPTWTVVTANQELRTFAARMKAYWHDLHGEELEIAIDHESSKPDFTAIGVRSRLHAVEIKRPGHNFNDSDYVRFEKYIQAFRTLFAEHQSLGDDFPKGWTILLVCDGMNVRDTTKKEAISSFEDKQEVERITWNDFLTRAQRANSAFLDARFEVRRAIANL